MTSASLPCDSTRRRSQSLATSPAPIGPPMTRTPVLGSGCDGDDTLHHRPAAAAKLICRPRDPEQEVRHARLPERPPPELLRKRAQARIEHALELADAAALSLLLQADPAAATAQVDD